MKFSKTQTLALFLGTAASLTPTEFLNGPGSEDNVPADQRLTKASSGTTCDNGNADCTEQDEKCGNFQAAETTNICIYYDYCGSLGRIDGEPFAVPCWEDPEDGADAVAPSAVSDKAQDIADLKPIVVTDAVAWDDDAANLWISPRYKYMDGWWTLMVDGDNANKWVETDAPAFETQDGECHIDNQCESAFPGQNMCCGEYPDSNHKICFNRDKHGLEQTFGPLTFIPFCMSEKENNQDDDPINAGDQIANSDLAKATEKLTGYFEGVKADRQDAEGYADMSEADQEKWDEEWEADQNARIAKVNELKTDMGYDLEDCTAECKERFETQLYDHYQEKLTYCKDDANGIACRKADEIFAKRISIQKGDPDDDEKKNWFTEMDLAERNQFKEDWKELRKSEEATLTAKWMKDNKPGAGKEGSDCGGDEDSVVSTAKCTGENQCCGTSTLNDNFVGDKLEKICVDKTTLKYTDSLDREYTHVCDLAAKLMAAAAAAATMATSLM